MLSDMRVSELGDRILIDLPEVTPTACASGLRTSFSAKTSRCATPVLTSVTSPSTARRLGDSRIRAGAVQPRGPGAATARRKPGAPFGDTPAVVVKSDDYGVAGFEIFASASDVAKLADAMRAAGAKDGTADAVEVAAGRSGPSRVRSRHGRAHDSARSGNRDAGDQLHEGLLCRAGGDHPGPAPRPGACRQTSRRALGRAADGPLARGMRIAAGNKGTGSITSAVESPRLGRPIALGYVHRDSAEPGTVLQATAEEAGSVPSTVIVVTTPFIQPASE